MAGFPGKYEGISAKKSTHSTKNKKQDIKNVKSYKEMPNSWCSSKC